MPRIQTIHTPAEMRNLAINGALDFWQEKVGNTTTVNTSSGTSGYSADMFAYQSGGVTTHNYSLVRSTDVPTFAESGFRSPYSILFTNITGSPSFAAGDWREPFLYKMEGSDYAKVHGKIVTFGFWIKASIVGIYSFAAKNSALNRSYVTTFSVNNPNTWEFKAITVRMDSSGTWTFDSTLGLSIHIASVTGSTFQTATLNQWQSGNFVMASTATNYQATSNATVRLAQFSIVEGSLGFGATGFQRAGKTIQQELALCQRYYEKSYDIETLPGTQTDTGRIAFHSATGFNTMSNLTWLSFELKATKRVAPTVALYASGAANQTPRFTDAGGVTRVCSADQISTNRWSFKHADAAPTTGIFMHYVADARL